MVVQLKVASTSVSTKGVNLSNMQANSQIKVGQYYHVGLRCCFFAVHKDISIQIRFCACFNKREL